MKWYVPSVFGDFRLEMDKDDKENSALYIVDATRSEQELLGAFLAKARKNGWITQEQTKVENWNKAKVPISASVGKVGPVLVRATRPKRTTLTAIRYANGKIETESLAEPGALERLSERAESESMSESDSSESVAASVRRPTPSCPQCMVGEIAPAGEVLREFMTPQQHADWAQHRCIVVRGGITGYRYLLAHRNTPQAAKQGRMCYDLDNNLVVHFHDTWLPPEEEVLAAKLILEHREPWLRNEATLYQAPYTLRFKNPFGNGGDGTDSAAFTMSWKNRVETRLLIDDMMDFYDDIVGAS